MLLLEFNLAAMARGKVKGLLEEVGHCNKSCLMNLAAWK